MNLNDLRANAYGNMSQEAKKNNSTGKENSPNNNMNNNIVNHSPLFENVNNKVEKIFKESKKLSSQLKNTSLNSSNDTQKLIKVPATEQPTKKESVYRRVAKFLVLIGVEEAAKVLLHLTSEQTEKIIPEIATIRTISDEEATVILAEFQGLYKHVTEKGGKETARAILEKAYGSEKADELLKKAAPFEGNKPFDYLNDAKAERIKLLLNDESNAVKTLVLSNIDPKKAAEIINLMSTEDKAEIIRRLAKIESISPEILRRVDQSMHEKSNALLDVDKSENIDGRNALAAILKKMNPESENEIIENLIEEDPELGKDLKNRLFTIEDVINSDDKFIQEELRKMSNIEIIQLIAQKSDNFKEKILSCVSAGRRAEIKEDQEISTPIRKSDCDKITNQFFSILRRAYEDGKLIITGRNDDIYV